MNAAAYYSTAAAAGIVGGSMFALIWAQLVPSSVQRRFWLAMPELARSMLAAEQSQEFLDVYRRLGSSLFRYLGRNVGGLLLAGLPVTALMFAVGSSSVFFGMTAVGAVGALLLRRKSR